MVADEDDGSVSGILAGGERGVMSRYCLVMPSDAALIGPLCPASRAFRRSSKNFINHSRLFAFFIDNLRNVVSIDARSQSNRVVFCNRHDLKLLAQLQHHVRDLNVLLSRVLCRDLEDDVPLVVWDLLLRNSLDKLAQPGGRS